MNINDILPILGPGVFMQVLIKAYFIKHCWENSAFSQHKKTLYIIAIAVFNIPAAAAYLFLTRKKEADQQDDTGDYEIDSHIRQGIFVLLVVAYEVFSLRLLFMGMAADLSPVIKWLLSACFLLMIVHGLIGKKLPKALYHLLPAAQIPLILAVDYLDATRSGQFLVLAVMAGIVNAFPPKTSKIYSASMLTAYLTINILKVVSNPIISPDDIISYIYVNLLVYVMVFMSFYMLKKQLFLNTQLQAALKTMKEQSRKLEEMAVLAERSRITGEIHDTVGHTLTSAAIAIEAGEKLTKQDPEAAREKLVLAREQVRQGLLDIRQAVRTIQAGGEKDFQPAIHEWTEDIKRRTGLEITSIIEVQTNLLPIQQSVLLNALKECATNSLKHGHATRADLLIQEYKGAVTMTFTDNGSGAQEFEFGFGLNNMSRRAGSIGGTLTATGEKGEGFTVSITIPTGSATGGDNA